MKSIRTQKRINRWCNACKENNLPIKNSSKAYIDFLSGKLKFNEALQKYKNACYRHLNTNYDELWKNTRKEREQKARIMLKYYNMTFKQAMEKINKQYKPVLRAKAQKIDS